MASFVIYVIASGLCEAISTMEGIASSQKPLLAMTG